MVLVAAVPERHGGVGRQVRWIGVISGLRRGGMRFGLGWVYEGVEWRVHVNKVVIRNVSGQDDTCMKMSWPWCPREE